MPLQFQYEANDVCTLRISGLLKRDEFAAAQAELARKIDAGAKPRVLVIGENFEGWERGADWNDLDFLFSHSGEIARIAVVADPRWEVHALAFAGAGVRRAPVKFFPLNELAQARIWLAE
ncbi:MAG: STAS/SEC14 domain-containing protein [Chthoniobacterales bacterium]